MTIKRAIIYFSLVSLMPIAVLTFWVNLKILRADYIILDLQSAPTTTLAIVFGGGMLESGEQSKSQEDRVLVGVELYKLGKVQKIMVTGDDGGNHDDEVAAMKLQAIKLGVPKDDITIDPHGYRTYESCYRALAVYNVTNAIVVSQSYHIPRIIYLCRGLGVETIGVAADLRDYGIVWYESEMREVLARVKGWWQLEVSCPKPRSLAI